SARHLFVFSFYRSADHRDLHSFPTRRSSDLTDPVVDATGGGADQTGGSGTLVVDDPTRPFDPSPSSGDDHQGAGAAAGLLLTAGPGAGAPAVVGSGTAAAVQLLAAPGQGSPA